jgi:hypothetical protein
VPAPYDPVPVLNVSGEDIPSHAVVEPTGRVTDGAFEVRKPTRDGYRGVLVNGPGVIPTGQAGEAYAHPRVVVRVDGTPAVGEEWSAQAGSWGLGDTGGGFIILTTAVDGRVNAVRYGVSSGTSGSGADGGGGAGSLETITFDVVTAVNLDACTVTTRRITITGNGLSVVTSDPPSGGG